jgi:hypothetical protein
VKQGTWPHAKKAAQSSSRILCCSTGHLLRALWTHSTPVAFPSVEPDKVVEVIRSGDPTVSLAARPAESTARNSASTNSRRWAFPDAGVLFCQKAWVAKMSGQPF